MTRARELARLGNTSALTVDNSQNVGIGSLTPDVKLDVIGDAEISGVITATSFSGSGSALTGVASTNNIITGTAATFTGGVWVGSALTTSGITTVYNNTESTAINDGALVISGGVGIAKSLNVGGNVTVGGTLTYEDVTNIDVLGIATYRNSLYVGSSEGSGTGTGITFTTQGNAYFGKTGVVTATTFVGNITGNVTGNASGLYGSPAITVGTVVGSALTVSGITTVTNFETQGTLAEAFKTHTTAWNSNGNIDLSDGNLHYNSTNLGGTGAFLNLISTAGINTDLATGQALNVTAITAVNATTAFINALRIDGKGTGITTSWVGGSVPTAGGGSNVDTYSFNILKTASETYIVIANQVKTSA